MFLLLLCCIVLVHAESPIVQTGNAIAGGPSSTVKWTMPIPYWVSQLTEEMVTEAMQWFEKNTCIRFKEWGSEDFGKPYMNLGTNFGEGRIYCTSSLGQTSDNFILLNCAYSSWMVVREIAHNLGILYEQDRPDRSSYVKFSVPYGLAAALPNSESYQSFPYDYSSIMHIDPFQGNIFANHPNMKPVTENMNYLYAMGSMRIQGNDIFGINDFYQCLSNCSNVPAPACNNGGQQNPNDCTACVCPPMFTGKLCGQKHPGIRPFNGVSCGGTITAINTTQSHEFLLKTKNASLDSECYFFIEKTDNSMKLRVTLTNYTETVPRYDIRMCQSAGVQIYSQGIFTNKALTVCHQTHLVSPVNFIQSKTKIVMRMFRSDPTNVGITETRIRFNYRQVV